MKVALLYEHPSWSRELLERLQKRAVEVHPIDVGATRYSPEMVSEQCDLWLNRVNAMPSAGRSASVVGATNHLLLTLELQDQRVVNGWRAHQIGGSKAAQSALFTKLGLPTPPSIAVSSNDAMVEAAKALGFPVLTKPNIGGSGRGIVRHESVNELVNAIAAGVVDLGVDGTGLVQRVVDSADSQIYRIEILGDELFYATTQAIRSSAFNYCAIDGCGTDSDGAGDEGSMIDLASPTPEVVDEARTIVRAAGADLGGVEFLIDHESGERQYYDFNPYSNFVSGKDDALGFDPIERYLDYALDPPASCAPGLAHVG